MGTFLRSFAALIAVGAMGSAALGVSVIGASVTPTRSSHSARPAAMLIAAAATNPSPDTTVYDY
jgi:hypothetical protein